MLSSNRPQRETTVQDATPTFVPIKPLDMFNMTWKLRHVNGNKTKYFLLRTQGNFQLCVCANWTSSARWLPKKRPFQHLPAINHWIFFTSRDHFQPCLWRQNKVGDQLPDEWPLLKRCQCVNNFKRETTGYAVLIVVTEPGGQHGWYDRYFQHICGLQKLTLSAFILALGLYTEYKRSISRGSPVSNPATFSQLIKWSIKSKSVANYFPDQLTDVVIFQAKYVKHLLVPASEMSGFAAFLCNLWVLLVEQKKQR